ncbi:lipocalin-like domain-containing protein [Caballeronia jiangsuensis]|uniref:Lipocalin-like domain-containing protein n=1 Tax=Caballeronia jiangsuensis TaxID=1458357 RepID=A0ABW9CY47_9BURK
MEQRGLVMKTVFAVLCASAALPADAQNLKQQVVGTWTLTSGSEKLANGKTIVPWASGNLMLDSTGHMAFYLVGKDRPRTIANPSVPIGPVIAYYGTYTVDESASTLTYNVESSTSPAFDGAVRKQQVVLSGDMLTTTGSPVKTSDGEIVPTNEWKRAK